MKHYRKPTAASMLPLFADVVVHPTNNKALGHYDGKHGIIEKAHKVYSTKRDASTNGKVVTGETFEYLVCFAHATGHNESKWFSAGSVQLSQCA